jgi:hypothetical protein
MATRQRIDRLAADLTPKEHILAWLSEARDYPTLADYAREMVDQGPPLTRILRDVARSAEASAMNEAANGAGVAKTRRRTAATDDSKVRRTVQRAVRDAAYLYALVFRMNEVVRDTGLRAALAAATSLVAHRNFYYAPILVLRSGYDFEADLKENGGTFWPAWVAGARDALLLADVLASARARLQDRYFDGQDVLLSDAVEIDRLLNRHAADVRLLADEADPGGTARRRRKRPSDRIDQAGFEALVNATVAAIRTEARADALRLFGEHDEASRVLETHLRRSG